MKIREMKNGDRETFKALLMSAREMPGKNGPYCILTLRTGKKDPAFEAKLWQTAREDLYREISPMTPVTVSIAASEYNGEMGYVASSVEADKGGSIDDYIETSDTPGEKIFEAIVNNVAGYGDHCDSQAAKIAVALYNDYKDKLCYWPGSTKVHHAYKGGLVAHSAGTMSGCIRMVKADAMSRKEMTVQEMLKAAFDILKTCEQSESTRIATAIFRKYASCKDESLIREKYMTILITDLLCRDYKNSCDRSMALAVAALRGCAKILSWMGTLSEVLGGTPSSGFADAQLIRACIKEESECTDLLLHGLVADIYEGIHPVTPEIYIAITAQYAARVILEDETPVRPEILISAAAIHDIGKLKEVESDEYGRTDYGLQGNLFGHTGIGLFMVADKAKELNLSGNEETKLLLSCIATHHGRKEWGALKEPETKEEKLLPLMDLLNARLDIYIRRQRGMAAGERDESTRRYIGSIVYKPNHK